MYKLELVNKKTKEVTIFDDIADINYGEKLFFNFEINATQLADGEYTLSLFEDGKLIVTDTLCVGDFDVVGLQYKKDEAIYIETKLKTKTQDKSVKVSDIATTIIPDEDYDAMTTVKVNAQPVYDGAYNAGKEEGKQEGIEEGKEIQKGKLESITITENGVYTKEDGYGTVTVNVEDTNGSYDDGYTAGYDSGIEAQKGKLENLIVTENGEYTREDGYGKVTVDVGQISGINFSLIGYDKELSYELNAKWNSDVEYSKTLLDAWDPAKTDTRYLYINNTNLVYAPNIDTSNVTDMNYMFLGCSFLQVVPLLNTSKVESMSDMFDGCTSLQTVPLLNTSNVKDMSKMFYNCTSLQTVPLLNTSNVKDMSNMFFNCTSLQTVALFDTSNVTTMKNMFQKCNKLQTVPLFDTSNVTTMNYMFQACSTLTEIPQFNTSNVNDMGSMFYGCDKMERVPLLNASKVTTISGLFGFSNITSLTDFGGLKDLKIDWNSYGSPKYLPNLTYESLISILTNLYDFRANGDSTTTKNIALHSNHLAMLSDEDKAIATSKGWVIQS